MSGLYSTGRPSAPPRPPKAMKPAKPAPQARMGTSEHRRNSTATKEPKRAYKGRNSQESGKLFEKMLETACDKYSDEKVAKVSKTVEPLRVIGVLSTQPEVFKCVAEKETEPDFKGIMASGRAVAFESIAAGQDRIEWGAVTECRRWHLESHYRMNGLAFVMISFNLRKFYRVPWWVWRDMKALYDRKYLKAEDIPEFEVPLVVYYGKPAVLFLENIEEDPVCGEEEDL